MLSLRLLSRLPTTSSSSSLLLRPFALNHQLRDEAKESSAQPEDRGNKTSLVGIPFVVTDPETSIRYVESPAYKETYGNDPVWLHYRRNFKGQIVKRTRKMCVRAGLYATGNPCPICRDNHLVPYYRNVKLLKQFISPYSGQVLDSMQTNVCQKQHQNILVAVDQAMDYGLIDMPFGERNYDYKDYYGDLMTEETVKQ